MRNETQIHESEKTMKKTNRDVVHETVYHAAQAKGAIAAQACTPAPMVVQEHENMMDDKSPVRQSWYVEGGVCGFAWVIVKPGTSSFARWLKKKGYARRDYYGGMSIRVPGYNQSMQKKVAHAEAMADYLYKVGINAYAQSRMD